MTALQPGLLLGARKARQQMDGHRGLTSPQRKALAASLRKRANGQPGLDPARRQNMRRIASNLEKLAANPPPSQGGKRSAPPQRRQAPSDS
jgi:hypothetical protein